MVWREIFKDEYEFHRRKTVSVAAVLLSHDHRLESRAFSYVTSSHPSSVWGHVPYMCGRWLHSWVQYVCLHGCGGKYTLVNVGVFGFCFIHELWNIRFLRKSDGFFFVLSGTLIDPRNKSFKVSILIVDFFFPYLVKC